MSLADSRLDTIARGLAGGMSRREALRAGGAAFLGVVAVTPTDAWASVTGHCPHHRVRCHGTCCPKGEVCHAPKHKGGKHRCACPYHERRCEGACVNIHSDPHNCGHCGHKCGTGQHCFEGACACPPGQTLCAGACVDLMSSAQHCGACGTACAPGAVCANGVCASQCPTGMTACGGACVSLATDPNHCGSCTTACPAGMTCAGGTCGCPAGTAICGGACVDQMNDAAHCGVNCVDCNTLPFVARAHCSSGTCVIDQCAPNWVDCDHNPLNGCETLGTVCH